MKHSQRNIGWEQTSCAAQPGDSLSSPLEKGQAPSQTGQWFGGVSHAPTLCRRAEGASSVGSSFLQHPCNGDRKSGPAHPFPSSSKVPPVMPCGHWGTKLPPPSWLRPSRSPRCHGAGVVRASSAALRTLPGPPFLSSLPLLLPKSKCQGWGPWPSCLQGGCRYQGPHCS